ncbi:hypothetical protein AMTRI_Chr13g124980 [Amborella trichopoda]
MESLELLKILAGVFAGFMIHQLWMWPEKKKRKLEAPEPLGSRPILGHLPLLSVSSLPYRLLADLADKYGPVITLRLGWRRTLIVSGWEAAKDCFTTNDRVFATRPHNPASEYLAYNRAMLGFAPYGPLWRESRKITTHELLSPRRVELLKHVRISEVDMCVRDLHRQCVESKQDSARVEMKQMLQDLTFNVITRMVAGKRFKGGRAGGSEEAQRFQELIEVLFRLAATPDVTDALPFLRLIGVGGHKRTMLSVSEELGAMFEGWVEERRRENRSGKDFLDVLVASVTEGNFPATHTSNTIIKALALNLITGGTDTSASTMAWVVALLLNNRLVLEKVQAELDLHVGRDRVVQETDIKHLTYLNAVIKETMRPCPVSPLLVPHEAMEDCIVGGYAVRARDPSAWEDPEEFKPERFLTTKVEVDVYGKHFELIPFGSGRRSCSGSLLAMHVMQLTLARLLQAFEWDTPNGEKVDLSESFGLTMRIDRPLDVAVKPRLSMELYQ